MSRGESVHGYRHEAVATVLRVHLPADGGAGSLQVLASRRHRDPFTGLWSLPSGPLEPDEMLGACVARHLATKVDLTEIAHLEQLETRSNPERDPWQRTVGTAYLGLVPSTADPALPEGSEWLDTAALPEMAFDHASIATSAIDRLRRKLSYTNLGFALAPPEFTLATLRGIYQAALGYPLSVTNLQRVLTRRGQLEPTGELAETTERGGRPAKLFHFTQHSVEITDPFPALKPR